MATKRQKLRMKNKLAQTRDELRDKITELLDIIDSLDRADDAFGEGAQLLEEAVDNASEHL